MNLRKLYLSLVAKAERENGKVLYPHKRGANPRNRVEGTEIHHKIPKSWGGSDEPENLVRFTYRQHFTAHHILARLCGGVMSEAFRCMCHTNRVKVTSRQYETAKKLDSEARSERMKGIHSPWLQTPEVRAKIGEALRGTKRDPAIIAKILATRLERGSIYTPEQRLEAAERTREVNRLRAERKRKERGCLSKSEACKLRMSDPAHVEKVREKLKAIVLTCPHCDKTGGAGMYRWHFDNCKHKAGLNVQA
jgi:hypothetical protein